MKLARYNLVFVMLALALPCGTAFGMAAASAASVGVAGQTSCLTNTVCSWIPAAPVDLTARPAVPTGLPPITEYDPGYNSDEWAVANEDMGKKLTLSACGESGGMLILAVAASWLITLMLRNGGRTVYYRNGLNVRTSFGEETKLSLSGARR